MLFDQGTVEECTALASQSVQRFLPEAARYQPLLHASYLRSFLVIVFENIDVFEDQFS